MPDSRPHHFFFAGGGTGGHIYPALAVADKLRTLRTDCSVLFFCSRREIDARILSKTGYEFFPLPAIGLSKHPRKLIQFFAQFVKSYYFVKQLLAPFKGDAALIGTGGFVTAPAAMAARSLKIPVYLINVDRVPGKANRFLGRFAEKIFVQFEDTATYFKNDRVQTTGCPLREGFDNPAPQKAISELGLDADKKIVLVTGASSGSMNINKAMASIPGELSEFAESWQLVHLTGHLHIDEVKDAAGGSAVTCHAVGYYDDMPNLLAAADIVVGRAGAVSVAEYAAAGKPAICIPYPWHKDRHQYENARKLVDAGAGVIVEDNPQSPVQTSRELMVMLKSLMANPQKRQTMSIAAQKIAKPQAAETICRHLCNAGLR